MDDKEGSEEEEQEKEESEAELKRHKLILQFQIRK